MAPRKRLIPDVTQADMENSAEETARSRDLGFDRHYPLWTAGFRASFDEWSVNFYVTDGNMLSVTAFDLERIAELFQVLETMGWTPNIAPDNKTRSADPLDEDKRIGRSTYAGANTRQAAYEISDGWRDNPVSEKQINLLSQLGYRGNTRRMTAGEASDLIGELKTKQRR